jgi:hypothetical protein
MPKTKKTADVAQSLARTISRIEADLRALEDACRMMADELAAAHLASAKAAEAQHVAEASRDVAFARLAEVEQEVESERSVHRLVAAKLREIGELLDANSRTAEAPQRRDADGSGAKREDAASPVVDAAILPVRLPRTVADACADVVARGGAPDIETALLQLAELGLQVLGRPLLSDTLSVEARPELLPSPG